MVPSPSEGGRFTCTKGGRCKCVKTVLLLCLRWGRSKIIRPAFFASTLLLVLRFCLFLKRLPGADGLFALIQRPRGPVCPSPRKRSSLAGQSERPVHCLSCITLSESEGQQRDGARTRPAPSHASCPLKCLPSPDRRAAHLPLPAVESTFYRVVLLCRPEGSSRGSFG